MQKNLIWRDILIIVVVALAVFLLYPPGEKIKLGLDLQGGMHLIMRVRASDAIKARSLSLSLLMILTSQPALPSTFTALPMKGPAGKRPAPGL